MVNEKMAVLKQILAEMANLKSAHRSWLKNYPKRPGVDWQYLAEHLAAGQSLAASALTTLFLTEGGDSVRRLLRNRDEGSESSRNFPFHYAHLLLVDLLAAWNKEELFGLKEFVLREDADADRRMAVIADFLEALACNNDRVAKKLAFFQADSADAVFDRR